MHIPTNFTKFQKGKFSVSCHVLVSPAHDKLSAIFDARPQLGGKDLYGVYFGAQCCLLFMDVKCKEAVPCNLHLRKRKEQGPATPLVQLKVTGKKQGL